MTADRAEQLGLSRGENTKRCPSLVTRTRNVRARCVDGEVGTLSLVTRTRNMQQHSLRGGLLH